MPFIQRCPSDHYNRFHCSLTFTISITSSCRHGAIADYFGDPKPNCGKSCDFCKNPREVKEAARDMKLCQKGGGRVGGGGGGGGGGL